MQSRANKWASLIAAMAVGVAATCVAAPPAVAQPDAPVSASTSPAPGARPVAVPAAGRAVSTRHPDHWVGHGTAASCTSAAFVAAVRAGGIIRFRCGPKRVTIHLTASAKVSNTHSRVVVDGGNLVTLDGGNRHRILYLDTCDPAQTWTTSHCQNQATPQLVVQNVTLAHGNSSGQDYDGVVSMLCLRHKLREA